MLVKRAVCTKGLLDKRAVCKNGCFLIRHTVKNPSVNGTLIFLFQVPLEDYLNPWSSSEFATTAGENENVRFLSVHTNLTVTILEFY